MSSKSLRAELSPLSVPKFPPSSSYSCCSTSLIICCANGNLDVRLFGRAINVRRWAGPFPDLGRWGRRVSSKDVGPDGAIYQLRFQRAHPEFDLNLAPDALVTVNLAIPGQGVFGASNSVVRLRPLSRYRDNVQLRTGGRFLPQEYTRREQPLEQRPLWFSHTRGLPGIGR